MLAEKKTCRMNKKWEKNEIKYWKLASALNKWNEVNEVMQTWPTTNHSIISWFIMTKNRCTLYTLSHTCHLFVNWSKLFCQFALPTLRLRIQFYSSDWRISSKWRLPFFDIYIYLKWKSTRMHAICNNIDWEKIASKLYWRTGSQPLKVCVLSGRKIALHKIQSKFRLITAKKNTQWYA